MSNFRHWKKKKKTEKRQELAKIQEKIDSNIKETVPETISVGSRIKVMGPGGYKGSLGYIVHLKLNEYALCYLDLAGPKYIKIDINRISLFKQSYDS